MQIARVLILTIVASLVLSSGVALLPVSGASSPPDSSPAQTPPAGDGATPDGAALTPGESELLEWATARFLLVGLHLPEVDLSFHDDTEVCGFDDGIYRDQDGRHRLLICVPDRGTFASNLERQRTLVHELAHAWDQANLDDLDRQKLLPILDAEDWYAPDEAWEDRGAERFAETIVWGLYDQLRRPKLIDTPCAELHADFHSITGHSAPSPVADGCGIRRSGR